MSSLRLTEIFFSLQGETRSTGLPTVFVRLTGCPLRCHYCDTSYAFQGGKLWTVAEVMTEIKRYQTRYITVTGGEPLVQPTCLILLKALCDANYIVSLETSGAMPLAKVDPRVVKVVDIKTPGSGESNRQLWDELTYLNSQDQIKFVICDEQDYQWSQAILKQYDLSARCEILFSPSYQQLPAQDLAEWILRDQLPVRMQIQLHKYLWGDQPGK